MSSTKDDYALFVELSLKQCLKTDYADKRRVATHNRAATQLLTLQKSMAQTACTETLERLLTHPDCRVRLNGATMCLTEGRCSREAVAVLQELAADCHDSMIAFNAEMVLKNLL